MVFYCNKFKGQSSEGLYNIDRVQCETIALEFDPSKSKYRITLDNGMLIGEVYSDEQSGFIPLFASTNFNLICC